MKCGKGHTFDDTGTNCPDCNYDAGYEAAGSEYKQKLESMTADRDQARRTSEYWKADHLAGNEEIKKLKSHGLLCATFYDQEKTKREAADLRNVGLLKLFSEVAGIFELRTRPDIDGLLRARIQEALKSTEKPKSEFEWPDIDLQEGANPCGCVVKFEGVYPCIQHDKSKA